MRKIVFIIIIQLSVVGAASGQDPVECTQLLEDAREAYVAGIVELVPELLNFCIEDGLSGTAKQEAYILVITSYLFDYLPDKANVLMNRFLADFPNYQSRASDPTEFTLLLESFREENALPVILPEEEDEGRDNYPEETEETDSTELVPPPPDQERSSHVSYRQSTGPVLGVLTGSNLGIPQVIEPYGLSNPLKNGGNFSMGDPGMQFGLSVFLPLTDVIEIGVDLLYHRTGFEFTADPYPFTSYTYAENQTRVVLPVSVLFNLNPSAKFKVYIRAGFLPDYLLSASASAVRYFDGEAAGSPNVSVAETDITSMRTGLNLSLMAGTGMKFPLNFGFIFLEARYQQGILMSNLDAKRYSNEEFIWQIYHVDSDFRLRYFDVSAGLVFKLKK